MEMIFLDVAESAKFCDVVAWAGSGSNQALAHIRSARNDMGKENQADSWAVYLGGLGNTKYLTLNGSDPAYTSANFGQYFSSNTFYGWC